MSAPPAPPLPRTASAPASSTPAAAAAAKQRVSIEVALQLAKQEAGANVIKIAVDLARKNAEKAALFRATFRARRDQLQKRRRFPMPVTHPDEAYCAICGSGESVPRNQIVFCDGPCNYAFHQMCVGLDAIPDGKWFCSPPCSRGQKPKPGQHPLVDGNRIRSQGMGARRSRQYSDSEDEYLPEDMMEKVKTPVVTQEDLDEWERIQDEIWHPRHFSGPYAWRRLRPVAVPKSFERIAPLGKHYSLVWAEEDARRVARSARSRRRRKRDVPGDTASSETSEQSSKLEAMRRRLHYDSTYHESLDTLEDAKQITFDEPADTLLDATRPAGSIFVLDSEAARNSHLAGLMAQEETDKYDDTIRALPLEKRVSFVVAASCTGKPPVGVLPPPEKRSGATGTPSKSRPKPALRDAAFVKKDSTLLMMPPPTPTTQSMPHAMFYPKEHILERKIGEPNPQPAVPASFVLRSFRWDYDPEGRNGFLFPGNKRSELGADMSQRTTPIGMQFESLSAHYRMPRLFNFATQAYTADTDTEQLSARDPAALLNPNCWKRSLDIEKRWRKDVFEPKIGGTLEWEVAAVGTHQHDESKDGERKEKQKKAKEEAEKEANRKEAKAKEDQAKRDKDALRKKEAQKEAHKEKAPAATAKDVPMKDVAASTEPSAAAVPTVTKDAKMETTVGEKEAQKEAHKEKAPAATAKDVPMKDVAASTEPSAAAVPTVTKDAKMEATVPDVKAPKDAVNAHNKRQRDTKPVPKAKTEITEVKPAAPKVEPTPAKKAKLENGTAMPTALVPHAKDSGKPVAEDKKPAVETKAAASVIDRTRWKLSKEEARKESIRVAQVMDDLSVLVTAAMQKQLPEAFALRAAVGTSRWQDAPKWVPPPRAPTASAEVVMQNRRRRRIAKLKANRTFSSPKKDVSGLLMVPSTKDEVAAAARRALAPMRARSSRIVARRAKRKHREEQDMEDDKPRQLHRLRKMSTKKRESMDWETLMNQPLRPKSRRRASMSSHTTPRDQGFTEEEIDVARIDEDVLRDRQMLNQLLDRGDGAVPEYEAEMNDWIVANPAICDEEHGRGECDEVSHELWALQKAYALQVAVNNKRKMTLRDIGLVEGARHDAMWNEWCASHVGDDGKTPLAVAGMGPEMQKDLPHYMCEVLSYVPPKDPMPPSPKKKKGKKRKSSGPPPDASSSSDDDLVQMWPSGTFFYNHARYREIERYERKVLEAYATRFPWKQHSNKKDPFAKPIRKDVRRIMSSMIKQVCDSDRTRRAKIERLALEHEKRLMEQFDGMEFERRVDKNDYRACLNTVMSLLCRVEVAVEHARPRRMNSVGKRGSGRSRRSKHGDQEVYCVCRRPAKPDQIMIGCDVCGEWFHTNCIHVGPLYALMSDQYVCRPCSARTGKLTTFYPGYPEKAAAEVAARPVYGRAVNVPPAVAVAQMRAAREGTTQAATFPPVGMASANGTTAAAAVPAPVPVPVAPSPVIEPDDDARLVLRLGKIQYQLKQMSNRKRGGDFPMMPLVPIADPPDALSIFPEVERKTDRVRGFRYEVNAITYDGIPFMYGRGTHSRRRAGEQAEAQRVLDMARYDEILEEKGLVPDRGPLPDAGPLRVRVRLLSSSSSSSKKKKGRGAKRARTEAIVTEVGGFHAAELPSEMALQLRRNADQDAWHVERMAAEYSAPGSAVYFDAHEALSKRKVKKRRLS